MSDFTLPSSLGDRYLWKRKYSSECYTTFERSGTDWDSLVLKSMVAISLQWHWGYRTLKLHHWVWSVSSGLILLDWIGDVIPLLTGRQSCKPGVTGRWGMECSCWWLWRGFLSLTAERGIYVSCYIHFYPPSLWQIYHTLIFLACRVLSIFYGCKPKLKRPMKASAIFKSLRIRERKIWQINFSFLLRVESGGRNKRKGGWENSGSQIRKHSSKLLLKLKH